MIFRQFLHTDPVIAASYLFGCAGHGVGAVVDPVGDINTYLEQSRQFGLRLAYVIDTHVHADHLSPGRDLAQASGAVYVLHASAAATFSFHGVEDGGKLTLGNVSAEVLHVPGHTPEHLALLITDATRGAEPWMILTGHTLMVGDMGRTELATSVEEGAKLLFQSMTRLRTFPDYVEVFPGAYAGSVCGRGLSGKPSSTIGFERRHNKGMGYEREDDFVAFMMKKIPPPPPNAAMIRRTNLGLSSGPES